MLIRDAEGREVDSDMSPRGTSFGEPPAGLRNWICEYDGFIVDGHEDPDWSGLCIHCGKAPEETAKDWLWNRVES